jgi:hypothetical protein
VAGGRGQAKELTQLSYPLGLWVDEIGAVYFVEGMNDRVTRWSKLETRGVVVVGEYGRGNATNQFNCPQ